MEVLKTEVDLRFNKVLLLITRLQRFFFHTRLRLQTSKISGQTLNYYTQEGRLVNAPSRSRIPIAKKISKIEHKRVAKIDLEKISNVIQMRAQILWVTFTFICQ